MMVVMMSMPAPAHRRSRTASRGPPAACGSTATHISAAGGRSARPGDGSTGSRSTGTGGDSTDGGSVRTDSARCGATHYSSAISGCDTSGSTDTRSRVPSRTSHLSSANSCTTGDATNSSTFGCTAAFD